LLEHFLFTSFHISVLTKYHYENIATVHQYNNGKKFRRGINMLWAKSPKKKRAYLKVVPPSTTRVCPVIHDASSVQRK
jgi:hypothetical protein